MSRLAVLCLLPTAYCLLVSACQPARLAHRERAAVQVLRVNILREAGYAPLLLMQRRRLLERRVPDLAVEWKVIPTQEAVYQALALGGLDVATGSAVAFLLAGEHGLRARVVAGVSELPLGLVGSRAEARSLRDLGSDDRIAVPARGGLEHVLLRMAALRELGDWRSLDPLVVPRAHPEAFTALLARRDVTAHVAESPFLDDELETPGLHRLVDGSEVMGGPTSTVVAFSTTALYERHDALFAAFRDVLREATELATREPAEVAALLAEGDGYPMSAASVARYLGRGGLVFSTRVPGLARLAAFMEYSGQLTKAPDLDL